MLLPAVTCSGVIPSFLEGCHSLAISFELSRIFGSNSFKEYVICIPSNPRKTLVARFLLFGGILKSGNKDRDRDTEISPELAALRQPLETIIMEGGFDRDVSETGTFYFAEVEATYLGKLLNALPIPGLLLNQQLEIIFANEATSSALVAKQLRGKNIVSILWTRAHGTKLCEILQSVFIRDKGILIETSLRLPDEKVWCRLHARRIKLGHEKLLLILVEDLTLEKRQIALRVKHQNELKQAHAQLERRVQVRTVELTGLTKRLRQEISERILAESELVLSARMIESSSEAILLIDVNGKVLRANESVTLITGYPNAEIVGQSIEFFQWGRRYGDLSQKIREAMVESGEWRGEVWDRRRTGEVYPAFLSISPIKNEKGEITHYVCILGDISQIKQTQKDLQRLAHYDSLTGLPNRVLFHDRLSQSLLLAHRHNKIVILMLLDLDRFKNINDTLGHSFGDKVLISVADKLKESLRASDTAARLGGDEFVLLLPSMSDTQGAMTVAQNLLDDFSKPLNIEGREIFLSVSIGVSTYPTDCSSPEDLLRHADMALHHAKERGKNHFRFYSHEMNAVAVRRQRLENTLRTLISRELFLLHYQPVVDISSGRIAGVEALLRWRHPNHGIVSAANLIPVAEETGLILDVGDWVLRNVCKQIKIWNDLGVRGLRTAINVSARQLKQRASAEALVRILEQSLIDPEYVEFELTESVMMDDTEETISIFRKLKSSGIKLSIDDFGTGYSSLSYLRKLPVDNVKIDGSFIKNLYANTYENALVKAIIEVAHSRNLRVIAEGVENDEQLKQLQLNGCDEVQGYLISRPLSATRMTEILKRHRSEPV